MDLSNVPSTSVGYTPTISRQLQQTSVCIYVCVNCLSQCFGASQGDVKCKHTSLHSLISTRLPLISDSFCRWLYCLYTGWDVCPREVFFVEFDTSISLLYHFPFKLNDQFMHSRKNVLTADGPTVSDTLSQLGSVTHYAAEWSIFGLVCTLHNME